MKFELQHDRRNITREDLLADLRRVASLGAQFSQRVYGQRGKYGVRTVIRRFRSWNNAVATAGLKIDFKQNISDEDLLSALGELWIKLGRQPKYSELTKPEFPFSTKPYEQRFGSWRKALEAFVAYANSNVRTANLLTKEPPKAKSRRTSRSINLRLRWQVLKRDNFRCCACGTSPAITPEAVFEFDHIVPWSNGGETQLDNLQTLCRACNQGKSNK